MAENGENRNQENPNQQQENNERQYICNACEEQPTSDLSKALSHSSRHKKNYSFACGKCAWVFKEYKIYESHFLGEHAAKHHQKHGKKQQPKADPPIRPVLEPAMSGRDMIGRAITCCGKTLVFGIPILDKTIQNHAPGSSRQMLFPSCLVLDPTWELTRQVQIEFEDTALNLSSVCLYGGMPIMNQVRQLEYGVDIAVGTPGRIIDLVERGSLILSEVKFVVLDEAGQMLAVGFPEDVECFLNYVPKQRRCSMLFSATMPSWVTQLSRKYLRNSLTIDLVGGSEQKLADGITLYSIATSSSWKENILPTLISTTEEDYVHRIGRTGVQGQQATTSFYTDRDMYREWNLAWIGKNKVAPLEDDETEMLLGYPKYHTRETNQTNRYKSLGNSFQVDTVAFHLPVLSMFPTGVTVLSLFSGTGGAEVALHRLGINVVSVEISELTRNILRSWWEQTDQKGSLIHIEDVQKLTADKLEQLIKTVG